MLGGKPPPPKNCDETVPNRSVRCARAYGEELRRCRSDYNNCLARLGQLEAWSRTSGVEQIDAREIEHAVFEEPASVGRSGDPLIECVNAANKALVECNSGCIDKEHERLCITNRKCVGDCADKYLADIENCESRDSAQKAK